jgi:hypothetical protein
MAAERDTIVACPGLGPNMSRSSEHDTQQPLHFRAPNDVVTYTIEELLDIVA